MTNQRVGENTDAVCGGGVGNGARSEEMVDV